jgi:hypothetical protein
MLLFGIFDVFQHEDADFRLPAAGTVGMTIFLDLEILRRSPSDKLGHCPKNMTAFGMKTIAPYNRGNQYK